MNKAIAFLIFGLDGFRVKLSLFNIRTENVEFKQMR